MTIEATRYYEITRKPKPDIEREKSLPALNPFAFTKEERSDMFMQAHTRWEQAFDPKKVMTTLHAAHDASDPKSAAFETLKKLRKTGQVIKTAYTFFDERHKLPEPLRAFIRDLGALNDHILTEEKQEYIDKVMHSLHQIPTTPTELDFHPAEDQSYQDALFDTYFEIDFQSQQEAYNEGALHTLRKKFRHLENLYKLASTTSHNAEFPQIKHFLGSIDERLGTVHDNMIQDSIRNKTPLEKQMVTLSGDTKDDVREVLDAFVLPNTYVTE